MRHQDFLSDPEQLIVIDASVAINLNATKNAAQVIRCFPNRIVITDIALAELESDVRNGRDDSRMFRGLIADGIVDVVILGEAGLREFEALIVGPASETLDDGEASTLAFAEDRGCVAVIDERKAHRIAGERYPERPIAMTVDIFSHSLVQLSVEKGELADIVFHALHQARMRVSKRHTAWVADLIGADRALLCDSLPRSVRNQCEVVANQR